MEIKDKVIIITGASEGIGLAAAKQLSNLGAKIVLAARSKEKLLAAEKEIKNSYAVVTDMTKDADVKNMIAKTLSKFGRVDILINNAGRGMYGPLEKINIEDYKKIMELNVYSVVFAMQEVIPHMRKQGGGMILNISSQVSKMYLPYLSAYASTKYALNALSLTARQELEKDNIIVSVLHPKMTATRFGENAVGARPSFDGTRERPQIDSAEYVAEKIAEIIRSEEPELRV